MQKIVNLKKVTLAGFHRESHICSQTFGLHYSQTFTVSSKIQINATYNC